MLTTISEPKTAIQPSKNEGTKGIEIVSGQVEADKGNLTIDNSASGGILIDQFEENTNNAVSNKNGKLTINNTGAGGITIKGNVYSDGYDSTITNTNGALNIESTGLVKNNTNKLTMNNSGTGGINIEGLVRAHGVDINNQNSDVVIGDNTSNDNYISSDGDVNIKITNGNLFKQRRCKNSYSN